MKEKVAYVKKIIVIFELVSCVVLAGAGIASSTEKSLVVNWATSNAQLVEGGRVRQTSVFLADAAGRVWMEAEEAHILNMLDGFALEADAAASGDMYAHHIQHIRLRFHLENGGHYRAWHRAFFPHAGNWHHQQRMSHSDLHRVQDREIEDGPSDGWVWVRGPRYELPAGNHEWIIPGFLGGAKLDKLLLTPDEHYIPSEQGDPATRLRPPAADVILSNWVRPFDVKTWLRLEGEPAMRDGEIFLDARLGPDAEWIPLGDDGSLPFDAATGGGEDRIQVRLRLQAAPGGPLPSLRNPRLVYGPGEADAIMVRHGQTEFRVDAGGLSNLRHAHNGVPLTVANAVSPLFDLQVRAPDHPNLETLPFSKAVYDSVEHSDSGLTLNYRFDRPSIRVGIEISFLADETLAWRLNIENDSDSEVRAIMFPNFQGLRVGASHADDTLLRGGRILRNPVESVIAGVNRPFLMLNYIALYDGEAGLYLANTDQEIHQTLYGNAKFNDVSLTANWTRYAAVPPNASFSGLEFRMGVYDGGTWHWAADRYREWAQSWMDPPPIPAWAQEAHGWEAYNSHLLPWEGLNVFEHYRAGAKRGLDRFMGANRLQTDGLVTYCGTVHPVSPLWGSEEQLRSQVEDMREWGGHMNSYFNWYRFAPVRSAADRVAGVQARAELPAELADQPWYSPSGAQAWYDENVVQVRPGGRGGLAAPTMHHEPTMCVGTKAWRDYQLFWLDDYTRRYGYDGMYYDQLPVVPDICVAENHDHPNISDSHRFTLETLRRMREAMKDNPHYASSGELASCVLGQGIAFHMISAVLSRSEVFRYTMPDYLLLDGRWNVGTHDIRGGVDRWHHIFITGCRFEQLPQREPDFGDRMLRLRDQTGQILYRSRYLDTVGLTLIAPDGSTIPNPPIPYLEEETEAENTEHTRMLDEEGLLIARPPRVVRAGREFAPVGGLQAKLFRHDRDNNRLLIVNMTNKEGIDGRVRVDTTGIGPIRAAWLFTLENGPRALDGRSDGSFYEFQAPTSRLSTVVLVNRSEPLIHWDMDAPHVAGDTATATVRILNLNDEPLAGTLSWELPHGWNADETVSFGPTPSGETWTGSMTFAIPAQTPNGRPELFVRAQADNETAARRFVPFTVVDPLRVYVREPGSWQLVVEAVNRSQHPLQGRVWVDAPEGLFTDSLHRDIDLPPRGVRLLTFAFDPAARCAVEHLLDVQVHAEGTDAVGRATTLKRPFRIMPAVPNASFDIDLANNGQPDYWRGMSEGVGDRRWDGFDFLQQDRTVFAQGVASARLDPNPETGYASLLRNLIARGPAGPGRFKLRFQARRAAEGRAWVEIQYPFRSRPIRFDIPEETDTWHALEYEIEASDPAAGWLEFKAENRTSGPIWIDSIRLIPVD